MVQFTEEEFDAMRATILMLRRELALCEAARAKLQAQLERLLYGVNNGN